MKRAELAKKNKAQLRAMASTIAQSDRTWGKGRSAWSKDDLVRNIAAWHTKSRSPGTATPRLHSPLLKGKSPRQVKAAAKRIQSGSPSKEDLEMVERMKEQLLKDKTFITNFSKSPPGSPSKQERANKILLNNWCRCVQETPIGICSSSVYSKRGLRAPATRGKGKSWCDDDLAKAERSMLKASPSKSRSSKK